MHDASKGFYLGCYLGKEPPHFHFQPLAAAERLWQQAEDAASPDPDPEKLLRVRVGDWPGRYACLARCPALRRECGEQNGEWPWPNSRKPVAADFRQIAQ